MKNAVDSSLSHLRRWLPWAVEEPSPLPVTRFRLDLHWAEFCCGHQWYFGIFPKAESRLYGVAGIHPLMDPGAFEVSYWLRRDATGRGFATEAAGELTRIALRRRAVRVVQIRCDPANERSAAVARRLGYRHLKTIRNTDPGPARHMIWQVESTGHVRNMQIMLPTWPR